MKSRAMIALLFLWLMRAAVRLMVKYIGVFLLDFWPCGVGFIVRGLVGLLAGFC